MTAGTRKARDREMTPSSDMVNVDLRQKVSESSLHPSSILVWRL